MLLKDFIPAPQVQEFVQLYRIVHLQFDSTMLIPPKAYPPRPEQCLAFYPYDREIVEYTSTKKKKANIPVVLYGQFTEVTNRMIGNNFLVFQIVFYPGALYKLLGIPSTIINNEYLSADEILGNHVHNINEQLFFAKDYMAMVAIANKFITTLIAKQQKATHFIDAVCSNMLYNSQPFSLVNAAQQAFLSTKQFERKFKERTGLNPKTFERVIKFDNAFRLKNAHPNFDWLKIAIECDYYDYQHLTKAYKDFTGLSPTAFHAIEEQAPERKLGLNEGYYK
ncbi:MAG: helix-turn-helix domain-containing protein [Chitinophagaceae bacterium]|nr:helix-turn-helix domain-containing protein [Chitinophagaceae bacterium]